MSSGETTDVEAGGIWSARYAPVTLAVLTVMAIVAFDGLALVAALPAIADDLGGVALLPWVVTAFLATSAVAGIAAGPVIDSIGVRRTFRVTGIWFVAASAMAAAAPTMVVLVITRALQGIGGGLVISVLYAAVGLAYPQRLRARAFAAGSMVWGVMGFGGPVIAAGLLAVADWRMIFVVQIPITALALAMGWKTLPTAAAATTATAATAGRGRAWLALDWVGIALVSVLVAASLVAVAQVGVRWWLAGAATAVSIVAAGAVWSHAGRSADPLVARAHLTRHPLSFIHLSAGAVMIAGLAADNYLPLYMQTSRGRSESFAAFSVVFLTVGWSLASVVVSRLLDRWHESDMILVGATGLLPSLALAGIGVWLTWPLAVIFAAFVAVGASIGFVSTSALTLMHANADPGEMGRVNAAHQFVRTISITYGIAVGGAILLLVVDQRVGDVEVVRSVLRGEEVDASAATLAAVSDGLAWVHVFSFAVGIACLSAAISLRRRTRGAHVQPPAPADAAAPAH